MKHPIDIKIIVAFIVTCILLVGVTLFSVYNNQGFLNASKDLHRVNSVLENVQTIKDSATKTMEVLFPTQQITSASDLILVEQQLQVLQQLSDSLKRIDLAGSPIALLRDTLLDRVSTFRVLAEHTTSSRRQEQTNDTDNNLALKYAFDQNLSSIIRMESQSRAQLRQYEFVQKRLADWATSINYIVAAFGFMMFLLVFVLLQHEFNRRKIVEEKLKTFNDQLEGLVSVKSAEINNIFERITNAFIALNNHWEITYVNKQFGELMQKDSRELIGKNVFDQFPQLKDSIVYSVFQTAFLEQKKQNVEHFAPYIEKWLDVFVYPALDGVTIFISDITERKTVQMALAKSEANYRSFIEKASDAIFISDASGIFTEVNDAACHLMGMTKDTLIGANGKEFAANPQYVLNFEKRIESFSNGDYVISQSVLKTRAGNILEVESSSRMLPDGRIISIVRDITERKKAELKLAESEQRLREILDNEPECIKLVGPDDILREINPAGLIMVEADGPESVIGHPITDLITEEFRLPYQRMRMAVFNGKRSSLTYQIIGFKGTLRWMEMHAVPMKNTHGQITEMLSVSRDITENKRVEKILRESEEKYRLLFESNPLPLMIVALDSGNIIDINNRAIEFYGYSRNEFLAMNAKDIRPTSEIEHFNSSFKTKSNTRTVFVGRWKHQKANGEIVTVELVTHEIIYNGVDARIVLVNDISSKVRAEAELQASYLQMKELSSHLQTVREEERANISREIHDELGQKLTSLKMSASWVAKYVDQDSINIQEKLDDMIRLIDETVKTVRRISSELRPGILDDLGLIAALEWQSEEFEKRTGIQCMYDFDLPEYSFDRELAIGVFRIYQESLTNITRHSHATKVETSMKELDGFIILTIVDNGVGFNINEIKSKKTLGLVGMKERAGMFGGKIDLQSSAGNGTTLMLHFPLLSKLKTLQHEYSHS